MKTHSNTSAGIACHSQSWYFYRCYLFEQIEQCDMGYAFGDIIIIYDGSYRSKDQQQGVVWAGVRTLPLHSFLGGAVLHPLSKLHWFSRRRRRVSPRFAPIVTVTPLSPYYAISGQRFTFPDRHSEVQYLINLGRYTNIHSDVIWSASYQSTFLFKAIT